MDNPAFIVKASEAIPSKKTIQLSIGFKAPANAPAPNNATQNAGKAPVSTPNPSKTGKLTITNPNTNTSWVFYLKYVAN